MMRDYSCAVGISLAPEIAPRTAALVRRAAFYTARGTGIAKDFYKRERPFRYDSGPTCQQQQELAGSYDYPFGHTTLGWTWAMLLTKLVPDRATPILARGRAFGESRIVCGVHNLSAVEAGRLSATVTLAAVEQTSDFQTDLAAAKTEIAGLRADPATPRPDASQCRQEAQLVAQKMPPALP